MSLSLKVLHQMVKTRQVSSRATHEMFWFEYKVCIYEFSKITTPQFFWNKSWRDISRTVSMLPRRDCSDHWRHLWLPRKMNLIGINLKTINLKQIHDQVQAKGLLSTLFCYKVELYAHRPAALSYSSAFLNIPAPDEVRFKWARYPSNDPNKLSFPCLLKVKELYDISKIRKKCEDEVGKAHHILQDTVVVDLLDPKHIMTVPKVKALFQLTSEKWSSR